MRRHPKPTIVLSKCLEFAACRYDGAKLRDDFVRALKPHVTFKTVCPEVEIGLGTPRDPIRIIATAGTEQLVQPATGKDLTGSMSRFSAQFLRGLSEVDGFIFKAKSPSCGIRDAKRFSGAGEKSSIGRGAGLFAAEILNRFPLSAIEDEARLTSFSIRERYLTHVFALARFREVRKSKSIKQLIHFQSKNKYLLMTQNEREMRAMGRIVANAPGLSVEKAMGDYETRLHSALSRSPRRATHINALQHGFGYVSKRLKANEKRLFRETVEKFAQEQVPLGAVTSLLRAWVVRYEVAYLEQQTYFEPFPPQLLSVCYSGKLRA